MSGASDKAQFYLEQSVPELRDWEKKGLFSKSEIQAITKRRSTYEHSLNSRDARPSIYAQYITYELNVESLRRKRAKRLGVKNPSHSGQRRAFFLLDRATRKFPGDLELWIQYVEYARRQKAFKKVSQILTSTLRMHPAKPELWIYAAGFAMEEHADMTEARSYMQRGLRFCRSSKTMWLEYAKLELMHVNKIAARRKILGIDAVEEMPTSAPPTSLDATADVVSLLAISHEDIAPEPPGKHDIDDTALKNLKDIPVLSGAIPITIFDAYMRQFPSSSTETGHAFLDLLSEFTDLPCLNAILNHVLDTLLQTSPNDPIVNAWHVKAPTLGLDISSPDFPKAFGQALSRLKTYTVQTSRAEDDTEVLRANISRWLGELLENDGLDPALGIVAKSSLRQLGKVG